jgi:hypothetical protein
MIEGNGGQLGEIRPVNGYLFVDAVGEELLDDMVDLRRPLLGGKI